jgi:hypothetical protein
MASATKQDLTAAEFASLCEVGQVFVRRIVPKKHEERLIRLDLIEHTRGGLVSDPARTIDGVTSVDRLRNRQHAEVWAGHVAMQQAQDDTRTNQTAVYVRQFRRPEARADPVRQQVEPCTI